jgi:hypothetical protein
MTDQDTTTALAYYATIGAALFPIPAGQKNPTGIVGSFVNDCSTDPAAWQAWRTSHPDCNFGVVAGKSNLIIVDIDTHTAGRDAAWQAWCELCATWNVAPFAPHVQSARGGWHVYFACDLPDLRQPDAVKKLINVRAGNGYVVAAGSTYDDKPYLFLSTEPPYPAPEALISHCKRATNRTNAASPAPGSRDKGDVAALIRWLAERDAFADYESWFQLGMALKLEFGDAGRELWALSHDDTVDSDTEATKWQSFAANPDGSSVTLSTFLDRAHKLGWRGSVRKSAAALFDGVAAIAAAAGAGLSSPLPAATPGPTGMPMLAGQAVLTGFCQPILDEFLAATSDVPSRPLSSDYPSLPASLDGHGLYTSLQQTISRIVAMAETPKNFKNSRVIDAAAVLSLVHRDTFDSVARRVRTLGCIWPDAKIKLAATALSDKVEREFVPQDDWQYDTKGLPEPDNSDNVAVFLGILGCAIRWNAWLERAEIKGGTGDLQWSEWSYIDDSVVAKLRTRGNRTKTRFRPGKDFFWESLLALAQQNTHDPVLDRLASLQAAWDGTPRLSIWLSRACSVPCDLYHQAVSRNIIGGMVRRARHPGCKHDTMAVLYGFQGSGKSTLAKLLATFDEWFSDSILLGDASKELVLSLAGKLVVEIGEMGMRGAANPNHVKAMISRTVDAGRTAYARAVSERKRRNIFIGTTNDDEPLVDPTGNRRFLPVKIDSEIDLAWLRENIEQIVGEAAAQQTAGHTFELPREVWGEAAERQEAARSASDIETMLQDWFGETAHTPVAFIIASDLVTLTHIAGLRHGGATAARGALMKKLGFRSEAILISGKRTRTWVRAPDKMLPAQIVRSGIRYMVGSTSDGRPRVEIRTNA